jgi:hypothetical protein
MMARRRHLVAICASFGLLALAAIVAGQTIAPPSAEPAPSVSSTALANALARCASAEMGAITKDERALLDEFAPELLSEFGPLLAPDSCTQQRLASDRCADSLSALSCEAIASSLTGAGYAEIPERAPDPVISSYAHAVAARAVACTLGEGVDEGEQIYAQYAATRIEVALASALALSSCNLHADSLEICLARVPQLPCRALGADGAEAPDPGKLLTTCSDLVRCTSPDAGAP